MILSDMVSYPLTYATGGNTWSGLKNSTDDKVTIDYILAMGRTKSRASNYAVDVDFKDVLVKDLKTNINNVSLSDHNSVYAKVKLGCSIN